jgi:hypothetical protein
MSDDGDDGDDGDDDQLLQLQRGTGRRGRRADTGGSEEEFVTEAPLPLRKVPRTVI